MTRFYTIPRNPLAAKTSAAGRLQRHEGKILRVSLIALFILEFFVLTPPFLVALSGFLLCAYALYSLHLYGVRGLPPLLYLYWLVKYLASRKKYVFTPVRAADSNEENGEREGARPRRARAGGETVKYAKRQK